MKEKDSDQPEFNDLTDIRKALWNLEQAIKNLYKEQIPVSAIMEWDYSFGAELEKTEGFDPDSDFGKLLLESSHNIIMAQQEYDSKDLDSLEIEANTDSQGRLFLNSTVNYKVYNELFIEDEYRDEMEKSLKIKSIDEKIEDFQKELSVGFNDYFGSHLWFWCEETDAHKVRVDFDFLPESTNNFRNDLFINKIEDWITDELLADLEWDDFHIDFQLTEEGKIIVHMDRKISVKEIYSAKKSFN
jgi:hypothetical protein